jgi:hypothetical protein
MTTRAEIREELRELIKLRSIIDQRIKSLRMRELVPTNNGRGMVDKSDLAPYLREWIGNGKTLGTLADKAMISVTTLEKILKEDTPGGVLESTADRILMALDLPHIYNQLVPPDPPPSQFYEE